MTSDRARFAADVMLGRLAKWLRLLGYDTSYGPHLHGRTLMRVARDEGRLLLTRDHRLMRAQRLGSAPPTLFIVDDHFRDQVRQVSAACQLDVTGLFTRCVRCNQAVVPLPRAAAEPHVPAYVFATQDQFVQCPRCKRIYWPATHHALVQREVDRLVLHPGAGVGT